MKRSLIAAIAFAGMGAWTIISDIFEAVTHLPVYMSPNIPYPGYTFVITWTDYITITQFGALGELIIAALLVLRSRQNPEEPAKYGTPMVDKKR